MEDLGYGGGGEGVVKCPEWEKLPGQCPGWEISPMFCLWTDTLLPVDKFDLACGQPIFLPADSKVFDCGQPILLPVVD